MSKNRQFLLFVAVAVIPISVGSAFLLTGVFEPSDNGLRCARSFGESVCEVRQTRFFGLAGNTSFTLPESSISGAESICAAGQVGRASPDCLVYLNLTAGPYPRYPVLSYSWFEPARAAAVRLNDYFRDKSVPSIEIKEDVLTPVLLFGVAPVLLVSLILGLRWWLRARRTPQADART